MSTSALLLRLLLCMILVLNGAGLAFAATDMELAHLSGGPGEPHADAMHATVADAGDGQTPCHGADAEPASSTAGHPGNDERPAGSDGCCPASHCACLQHLAAAVPQFVVRPAVIARVAGTRPATRAHPAPPVPHPIRPPIG